MILYDTKIEVMDWMIRYQLGQRNLSPVQRITVVKKYESKMKEEAQERKGIRTDLIKNENSTLSPIGHNVDTFGRTKEKLAKLANVGTGTMARYNVVMNFGREKNDDSKQRKVAVEYVNLCGMAHGGDRSSSDNQNLLYI